MLSRNDTCYSVGFNHEIVEEQTSIRRANLARIFAERTRNHFSGFARRNASFFSLIDPPITRSADLKILPGSARLGISFFCDITSTVSPLISMPRQKNRQFAPVFLSFARTKAVAQIYYTWCGTHRQKCGMYPAGHNSRHWPHGAPWRTTFPDE